MMNLTFSEIYQQYYKRSFLFVKSYVREDMAAEDIVSDTLINLWQTVRKDYVEFPVALLVTMLKNNSLNYLKHQDVKQAAAESISLKQHRDLYYRISTLEACDPQELFLLEISDIIERTLALLPEQTRRIFEMSRYDNKPIKEIAGELKISPKSVEYHITKSLKALRIALKEYLALLTFFFLN